MQMQTDLTSSFILYLKCSIVRARLEDQPLHVGGASQPFALGPTASGVLGFESPLASYI
jgi:hypothetical protein